MTTAREIAERLRGLARSMATIGHSEPPDLLREAARLIDDHESALLAERRRAIDAMDEVFHAAVDVALVYDDFSEPEPGQPETYNDARLRLYRALRAIEQHRSLSPSSPRGDTDG